MRVMFVQGSATVQRFSWFLMDELVLYCQRLRKVMDQLPEENKIKQIVEQMSQHGQHSLDQLFDELSTACSSKYQ